MHDDARAPDDRLDCIIIGGGPAGLTAATYLRRFHRNVLVFDDERSRARWIPETHNCPGFPLGVSGTQLLGRLREQARTYGAPIEHARIGHIAVDAEGWAVGDGERTWHARSVLLATGVQDRVPDLDGGTLDEAIAQGLLRLCAICDGYEATDQAIAVIGPRLHAVRHACFLTTFSSNVTVAPVDDADEPAELPEEWAQRAHERGIRILPAMRSIRCEDGRCELRDAQDAVHHFDTVYAAMGAPARNALALMAGAATGEDGAILTDGAQLTSQPGLYAIGDVVTDLNQISVAFGHAAIAATAIHRALPQARRP